MDKLKITIETWNDGDKPKWIFEIEEDFDKVASGEGETFTACVAQCLEYVAENNPFLQEEVVACDAGDEGEVYRIARSQVKAQKVVSYDPATDKAVLQCGHERYSPRKGIAPKKLLCPRCIEEKIHSPAC